MKSTKKSLIASALSLVLCVSMLLGTTFAWFTDSVTSGKNKIIAGNLDVELTHSNASVTNQKVQDATDLFGVSLWEPGVIAYENFTVTNVGNLALKYALNLNVFDKNATDAGNDLTEVIKVAVVEDGFKPTGTTAEAKRAEAQTLSFGTLADFQKTGNLAAGDTTGNTFGVVLYWQPTDNDNLYNLKNGLTTNDDQPLFVEFGVNLVATQDTVEADSFDTLYDLSAKLPTVASFPTITEKDIEDNKTVTIKEQGVISSASVPAKGAETVFEALKSDEEGTSNDLTLTLHVDETDKKETGELNKTLNLDLEISMEANMIITKTATGEVVDKKVQKVESLDEYTVLNMDLGKGYDIVNVKHNGVAMERLASASANVSDEFKNIGGFYYSSSDGILTLKTKNFSPFTIEAAKDNTFYIGEKGYKTLQDAFNAVKSSKYASAQTIKLAKDYTMTQNASINDYGNKHKITLDLGGHTISASPNGTFRSAVYNDIKTLIYVRGDGTFTLQNGNIICDDAGLSQDAATGYNNLTCSVLCLDYTDLKATVKDVKIESFGTGIYVKGATLVDLDADITSYLPNNTARRLYSNVAPLYIQNKVTKISGGTYSLLDKAMEGETYIANTISTNAALLAYGSSAKIGEIDGATFVSCAGTKGNDEAGIISLSSGASISSIKNTAMKFASTRATREFRSPFAMGNNGTIGSMDNVTFALGYSASYGYSFDTNKGNKSTVAEALTLFNNTFTNCTAAETGETQKVSFCNGSGTTISEVVEVTLPIIKVTAKAE